MALTERRTQIYLTEEQYQEVMNLARKRGSSLASVVREALDEFLSKATRVQIAPGLRTQRATWSDRYGYHLWQATVKASPTSVKPSIEASMSRAESDDLRR